MKIEIAEPFLCYERPLRWYTFSPLLFRKCHSGKVALKIFIKFIKLSWFTKLLVWSVLGSLFLTPTHLIPLNVPMLLLFIPLTLFFPSLGRSGEAVTYGFAWLEINQSWVWVLLFAWHIVIILIFLLFCRFFFRAIKKLKNRK